MKRKNRNGRIKMAGKSTELGAVKRQKSNSATANAWKITSLEPNKEMKDATACELEIKMEEELKKSETDEKLPANSKTLTPIRKKRRQKRKPHFRQGNLNSGQRININVRKAKPKIPDEMLPRLDVPDKFLWIDTAQYFQPRSDVVSSDDDVEEEKQVPAKRKKINKFRAQKKEENMLYKTEKMLMDVDRVPQTADDFDRAVLASPDNSLVWMQYMAFHLQSAEIEKARAVAERAIKIIGFREEQERLNIWVALLNLENLYGNKETLKAVLDRALQYNDSFKVYTSVAKIYFETNKFADAELIHKIILKKFNCDQEAWIGAGTFFLRSGQHEKSRELMERSLKMLDKRLHVDVICKFAQLEFLYGDPERGKLLFENVLTNYPKRTDKWSVYLDILIKLGNLEDVRNLFDRVLKLKMAVRKMMVFFKKYLSFEMKFGSEATVEAVRLKAKEFVDSRDSMEM